MTTNVLGGERVIKANTAKDGSGTEYIPLVDSDGHLQVDIQSGSSSNTEYTEGDTDATITGLAMLGEAPSNTLEALQLDASKHLQVDIAADSVGIGGGTQYTEGDTDASITGNALMWEDAADTLVAASATKPLPVDLGANNDVTVTGTVTANAGTNLNTSALALESGGNLDTIAGDTTSIDGKITACNTGAVVISSGAVTETNSGAIKTAVELIDNAISGNEMQVDVVAALPTGANAIGKLAANSGVDIGDVDVTSIVPGTGATNLGKAEDALHTTGDTGVMMLGVRNDTPSTLVNVDGDYSPISVDDYGRVLTKTVSATETVYNATGSGAISLSTSMSARFKLNHITIHFNAAPTTSENLTLTLNANDGAAYDTVLYSIDPSADSSTDVFWFPEKDVIFENGDELDLAFTNTDTKTYGARIVVEAI